MRQMGTRRRRRAHTTAGEHKGAGEGEGEGEGGGEEGVKEELPFIKDPLRWFGVLLPQNLPQAQKNFIEGIIIIITKWNRYNDNLYTCI